MRQYRYQGALFLCCLALVLLLLALWQPGVQASTSHTYRVFTHPVPGGREARDIEMTPDGTIWISTLEHVYRRSLQADQFEAVCPPPPDALVRDMHATADNAVWLSAKGVYWNPDITLLARIDPAGTVETYDLPPDTYPKRLAKDIVGNIWFSEGDTQMGRLAPTGEITWFALPEGYDEAYAVTLGPDDNMWYSAWDGVARISPDGAVTGFPVPASFGGWVPDLVTTPDGYLWFPERYGQKVARMTVEGEIETFPTSIQSDDPASLVLGWRGETLWVAAGNQMAQLSLQGVELASYTLDLDIWIYDMVVSDAHTVWFTDHEQTPTLGQLVFDSHFLFFPLLR